MKIRLIILVAMLLLEGCASKTQTERVSKTGNITISAAVSLKEAFSEIGTLYTTKTGTSVNFNFGASGALQKQIESGAPADVFASAGGPQMNQLAEKKLIDETSRKDFARNELVVISAIETPKVGSYKDLGSDKLARIAVGNPKTVPAGQYTEQFFANAGLKDKVQSKLIFAEDVRQVLDYVSRREVDLGIVYASDVTATGGERTKIVDVVPVKFHSPIVYSIAIVGDSKNRSAAGAFIELVLSVEGQAVLSKFGFLAAREVKSE